MTKSYAILPCNGLDKTTGCLSKELALQIQEQTEDSEIICPTFVRVSDVPYKKALTEKELLVIDGCGTRCAGKLAAEKGLKIAAKINVADESKKYGIATGTSLRLGENDLQLCERIVKDLLREPATTKAETEMVWFPQTLTYETYHKDKFIFRLPENEDFYFNENDCWAYVSGNKARIGVTDFVQKSLSDIMFFTPPGMGTAVEQFEDAGSIESGKAVYEVICPVSGKITAVNYELLDHPEYINENPYEKGWIAEVALSDFASDQELLLKFNEYFEVLKRKVDEFHV
ncbi:putative zinc-binding protein [Dehalobacter restrictus]|jgi:glycine cleavage system H protein|uniref:putative zinc-binding protein n=1 Tax=Dehalobacter restrictus TaxID=55583 RepID=UPI00338DE0FE